MCRENVRTRHFFCPSVYLRERDTERGERGRRRHRERQRGKGKKETRTERERNS